MNKLLFIIIPVLIILSLLLGLIPQPKQRECFADLDPTALIKTLKTLLDKYDNPELWTHAKRVHRMSTGELARDHLKL
jgi:hypothetical protein